MPTLKQLTCTVEWTGSNLPLQEFQTTYGDGYVQTFIAVPPIQTPFSVHLTSHGYIAPGLAMFVYMDGEYQCNRNRRNLQIPDETMRPGRTEIDFRVRQKEELQSDGTFVGQQWKFKELNIVTDSAAALEHPAPYDAEHVGTIEIVVLRCFPREESIFPKPPTRPNNIKSIPKVVKEATPKASANDSSDDTPSDDGSQSAFGGLFDGAGELPSSVPLMLTFGGDASWEQDNDRKNGGQSSWNRESNSQAWNGANNDGNEWETAAVNDSSPRWDIRRNPASDHFSQDWNQPSRVPQEAAEQSSTSHHNNHGSRRSGRSFSNQHNNSSALDTNNNWATGNPGQPSPAIIINVNQSPSLSRVGPPSVADSWKSKALPASFYEAPQGHVSSPNGSNHNGSIKSGSNKSGSHHRGSNKSHGSQGKNNDVTDWQTGGGHNDNWGAGASNVPEPWDQSNDHMQETWNGNKDSTGGFNDQTQRQWNGNNDTTAGEDDWGGQNNEPNNGQNNGVDNSWNNGVANGDWQNAAGNGSNDQTQGGPLNDERVLSVYPEWASPTQHQHGNGIDSNQMQQYSTWTNGNGGGNNNGSGSGKRCSSGDKLEKFGLGIGKGSNSTKDEPIGLFGSKPIPASESAKREGSIKFKHSRQQAAFTSGNPQSPFVAKLSASALPNVARAAPIPSKPKPYWSTWNYSPLDEVPELEDEIMEDPEPEEGPLYSVPAEIAQRNNTSHQVQAGKPAIYVHKVSNPKYMDSHDNPYAAFTFHYRSRAVIENMLGVSLVETEGEEKERLSSLSKEELIEHYLKAKANASSQKSALDSNDSDKPNDETAAGLGFGGDFADKLAQLNANKAPSEKASTNPELHWGRPQKGGNIWNNGATTSGVNVAGWLSNGGGGGMGSPPNNNSGGSSKDHNGKSGNNGSSGNQHGESWDASGGNGNSWDHNKNSGNFGSGSQDGHAGPWNGNGGGSNANGGNWNGDGGGGNVSEGWDAGRNDNNQSSWNERSGENQNISPWNHNDGAAHASWSGGSGGKKSSKAPSKVNVQW